MALVSSERRYAGRVIDLDVDTVRFPDGSTGQLEMIRHPGAMKALGWILGTLPLKGMIETSGCSWRE